MDDVLPQFSSCCPELSPCATRRRFAAASAGVSPIDRRGAARRDDQATNDATGVARTTATSATGDFSIPDLQLGTYTVEASLQGFQTVQSKVEVTVSRIVSLELKMGIAQVAETVTVSGVAARSTRCRRRSAT